MTRTNFLQGITTQVTINFKEEDLYPPIFSELYYTGVIEDTLVRKVSCENRVHFSKTIVPH